MLRKIQITNTTKITSSRLIKESRSSQILEMTLLKLYFYECTESTVQLVLYFLTNSLPVVPLALKYSQ